MTSDLIEAGIDYCPVHEGLREADQAECDYADDSKEPCDLRPLLYRDDPIPDLEDDPISDLELPGMWERADFEGGLDEVRGPDPEPLPVSEFDEPHKWTGGGR